MLYSKIQTKLPESRVQEIVANAVAIEKVRPSVLCGFWFGGDVCLSCACLGLVWDCLPALLVLLYLAAVVHPPTHHLTAQCTPSTHPRSSSRTRCPWS